MPQFQILEPNPSFTSQLGRSLGSGIGSGIQSALGEYQQQKKSRSALEGLAPLFKEAGIEMSPEEKELFVSSGLDPRAITPLLQQRARQVGAEQAKSEKEQRERQIGQDALTRISELVKKGSLGLGSKTTAKLFGGEKAEDVGEFEALSGALESMLVDRVSRGTLSNARFKYITETLLPKPNERLATIRGKLKGLARELDLELPEFDDSGLRKSEKISEEVGKKRPSLQEIFR